MTLAALLLLGILILGAVGIVLVVAMSRGNGRRYEGHAPYKGKVARFTGASGHVIEEEGKERGSSLS